MIPEPTMAARRKAVPTLSAIKRREMSTATKLFQPRP
jgi:hypothetical protein